MEVIFTAIALEDLKEWKKSGNKIIQKRIEQLINAIAQNPFEGIGKPEALKYNFTGYWSRRINDEHRPVYSVEDSIVTIVQLRDHY